MKKIVNTLMAIYFMFAISQAYAQSQDLAADTEEKSEVCLTQDQYDYLQENWKKILKDDYETFNEELNKEVTFVITEDSELLTPGCDILGEMVEVVLRRWFKEIDKETRDNLVGTIKELCEILVKDRENED
ncbi:hypothetical protein [Roseivirga sp. UBA1976]|uniref:hypothetical protein n=1 Tax=Roseivirga sp. UBA1976 TaxID=1947386 RepID=UPI00257BE042|nr:hypothetical protein [Roseivirga sp. UBA1976]MEC7753609.1 hypothetical protein [Bacteroidota bacterium]